MSPATSSLEGKSALITGGGTGIGRAIATAFVQAGAQVLITGRRRAPLEETQAALGGSPRAIAVMGDVTVESDRTRWLAAARESFGGLDALVNCAGLVTRAPVADTSPEDWRRVLETDAIAPILLARDALPLLRTRRGSILSISTGASMKPVRGFGAYGAAKAALNHASLVLALEAAPDVRVNVVCPGGVDTPIFGTYLSDEEAAAARAFFASAAPLGRIGRPEDIASVAVFLCSDAASFVTGTILPVDGGLNLG